MDTEDRRRAATGALGAAAWLGGVFAAGPLVGGFGLAAVGQWVIDLTPGTVSSTMIGLLGFLAQPLLLVGIAAATVALAAAVGRYWPRLPEVPDAIPVGLGALATAVLFLANGAGVSVGFVAGLVLAVVPPYLTVKLLRERPVAASRRRFLRRSGSLLVAGGVSLGLLRTGLGWITATPEAEGAGEPLPHDVSPPSGDQSFDFGEMPPAVTPSEDHYVVDINIEKPVVDGDSWQLEIDGAVAEPYVLTHEDLLEHDGRVEQTTTMLCISNEVGGDLIGTAHWSGVPLSDLVARARPDEEAVDVVTRSVDGYSEAIPLELVEREDILVAYGMGDRTLEAEHGFPARLLIPGRYGMKMTKWITRIEIANEDHEAYWEQRGWDEAAVVNTASYIRAVEREDDLVRVGGVAFAGLETGVEEIDRVEVSTDGGGTWNEAALEPAVAEHAWRRFRYEFEAPEPREYEFVCRAVERDGTVQTAERTDQRPGGATGRHHVTETV